MGSMHDALAELTALVDDGIELDLRQDDTSTYTLTVRITDDACADCLVPDESLQRIASDALRRRDIEVGDVLIRHER